MSLPISAVGEIASFLPAKSYFRFQRVNKEIYKETHNPIRLNIYTISSETFGSTLFRKKNEPMLLACRELAVDVYYFNKNVQNLQDIKLCKASRTALNALHLFDSMNSVHRMHQNITSELLTFLDKNIRSLPFDVHQIKKLCLKEVFVPNIELFSKITLFPNIEHLELCGFRLGEFKACDNDVVENGYISNCFPKLKSLKVDCMGQDFAFIWVQKIINCYCDQLVSLHVCHQDCINAQRVYSFGKLQELSVGPFIPSIISQNSDIFSAFTNATGIKTIEFVKQFKNEGYCGNDAISLKNGITFAMTLPQLECMKIGVSKRRLFGSVINIVSEVFNESRAMNKDKLLISYKIRFDLNTIYSAISQSMKHFVFVVDCGLTFTKDYVIVNQQKEDNSAALNSVNSKRKWKFTVSN